MTDKSQPPQKLSNFTIIWFGQTISLLGSGMTQFALSIWVWQLTGRATDLALFGFFSQLPQIFISLVSGVIVDRANRKLLMVLGDTVTGCLTILVFLLYGTNALQLWHLYLIVAIAGIFEQFQTLAFATSIATLVPQQHYSRASSMGFIASYGSDIIGPALASVLFISIGLGGIMAIDIATFVIAVTTVLFAKIPQPKSENPEKISRDNFANILQELSFGFRYLGQHSSLFILLIWVSLFWLVHDIGDSLYSAMILTRTNASRRSQTT